MLLPDKACLAREALCLPLYTVHMVLIRQEYPTAFVISHSCPLHPAWSHIQTGPAVPFLKPHKAIIMADQTNCTHIHFHGNMNDCIDQNGTKQLCPVRDELQLYILGCACSTEQEYLHCFLQPLRKSVCSHTYTLIISRLNHSCNCLHCSSVQRC